jgi:hypothetical protein
MTPSRTTTEISDHQQCCCASDDVGGQTTGDLTAALIKRPVQSAQEADLYFLSGESRRLQRWRGESTSLQGWDEANNRGSLHARSHDWGWMLA